MAYVKAEPFKFQSEDVNGNPLTLGTIEFYLWNTTTPTPYYTDSIGTSGGTSLTLNSLGKPANDIFFDTSIVYKLITKDSAGSTIDTLGPYAVSISGYDFSNTSDTALGDALIGVKKTGGSATTQHVINEVRGFSLKADFAAVGNGVSDDGPELVSGIAAGQYLDVSPGTYLNSSVTATLPLSQTLIQWPGASLTASGSGINTLTGNVVSFGYNPGSRTDWGATPTYNYEGITSDIGGYGARGFTAPGDVGIISSIVGAINIPSTAAIPAHAQGVGGYAKTASTTCGAVGVFGQGDAAATNAIPFGGNFLVQDKGFQTTFWGVEIDCNITHASSTGRGIDITGGSSVEPPATAGLRVGPLGAFTSPPKRWAKGIHIDDASSVIGIDMGATATSATSPSMPLKFFYYNGSTVRTEGLTINVDGSGNSTLSNTTSGTILTLQSYVAGVGQQNFRATGAQCGFFGSTGAAKGTITGSRDGNAALASLLTYLASLGLLTDSSS